MEQNIIKCPAGYIPAVGHFYPISLPFCSNSFSEFYGLEME
jgi:hypothetical protein